MKSIVRRHFKNEYLRFESSTGGTRANNLRVDVRYSQNSRTYLVECETRPNIKRLKAKASLRKKLHYRNNYILIVTDSEYRKHDWRQLRGHFDKIYSYDPEKDLITEMTDLRTLGLFQDFFLDLWMPIWITRLRYHWWVLYRNKNNLRRSIRELIQCSLCRRGLDSPWRYCPIYNCPNSTPLIE